MNRASFLEKIPGDLKIKKAGTVILVG